MASNSAHEKALAEVMRAPTVRELTRRLDDLPISADAKAILADLARITVRVGSQIVAIGRRIIGFALSVVATFPSMSFGVIVALMLSALVAAIPLLGTVLGPILTPLLVAFGLTQGALNDARRPDFQVRVDRIVADFQAALQPA